MRVILDTNVITAAMLSADGASRRILRGCLTQHLVPVMGEALFREAEDVLGRAHLMADSPLTAPEREELFNAYLSTCEWVKIFFLWRPNLPDENDNHLVELAVAGAVPVIITHNLRDLRKGELRFPSLTVLSPSEFLEKHPWQP